MANSTRSEKSPHDFNRAYRRPAAWARVKQAFDDRDDVRKALEEFEAYVGPAGCVRTALAYAMREYIKSGEKSPTFDPFGGSTPTELMTALIMRHRCERGISLSLIDRLTNHPSLSKDLPITKKEKKSVDNFLWAHAYQREGAASAQNRLLTAPIDPSQEIYNESFKKQLIESDPQFLLRMILGQMGQEDRTSVCRSFIMAILKNPHLFGEIEPALLAHLKQVFGEEAVAWTPKLVG